MIPKDVFRGKLADLVNCLPTRDGTVIEALAREQTYYRHLGGLDQDDYVEACDRIIMLDEWFPTIARIRSVAAECKHDRARTQAGIANQRPTMELVCPICHGARWVRLQEGYDPLNMHAGDEGSRTQACPGCMAGGVYYPDKERETIADQDGVPNENAQRVVDMSRTTWRVPRTPEGRVDMEALYRDSRVLRGLDPNVDARPSAVPGFKTMRQAMATAPERELVGVGADDDRPF